MIHIIEMSFKVVFILVYHIMFRNVNTETNLKSIIISVKTEYKFTLDYNLQNGLETKNLSNTNNLVIEENTIPSDTTIHYNSSETGFFPGKSELGYDENMSSQTLSPFETDQTSEENQETIRDSGIRPSFGWETGDHKSDTELIKTDLSKYKFFDSTGSRENKMKAHEESLVNTTRSVHTTPWPTTKQSDFRNSENSDEGIYIGTKIYPSSRNEKITDPKKTDRFQRYVFFQNSEEKSQEEDQSLQNLVEKDVETIPVETSTLPLSEEYVKRGDDNIWDIGSRSMDTTNKISEIMERTMPKYDFLEMHKRDRQVSNTEDSEKKIFKDTLFMNCKENLVPRVENEGSMRNPMTSTEHSVKVYSHSPYPVFELDSENDDINSVTSDNVDLRSFNDFQGAEKNENGRRTYDAMSKTMSKDFHTVKRPIFYNLEETSTEYSSSVQNHHSTSKSEGNADDVTETTVSKKYFFFDDSDLHDKVSSEDSEQFEPIHEEVQRKKNRSGQTETSHIFEETTTEIDTMSSTANNWISLASGNDLYTSDTNGNINNSNASGDNQVDEVLLQEIKSIVTKLHSAYFMVVADQLSMQSTTHLGKQTSTFAISPVCLAALLLTLSSGMSGQSRAQIDKGLDYHRNNEERLHAVELLLGLIPSTGTRLTSWSTTRLFVPHELAVRARFESQARRALGLNVENVHTVNASAAAEHVNKAIETDTKGRMPNAFDDDDLQDSLESGGLLLANCLYWRGDWQGSATVLNTTRIFHTKDGDQDLAMYRLNDVMRYADVPDWNALAVEIPYAAKNACLVLLIPREVDGLFDLEDLALNAENKTDVLAYLEPLLTTKRVQITLPKYTLESRIMLPSKLKEFGMDAMLSNSADMNGIVDGVTRLGSAVQRTKLWADDGRGSFKDDGLQWDPLPDVEVLADRPYIFMLKVEDIILISGHFYGSGR